MKAMFMSSVRTRASVLARAGLVLALVAVGLMVVGSAVVGGPLDGEAWFPPEIVTTKLPIGEPVDLTSGDFNGDGLPDLFLISEGNRPDLFFGIPNPDYEVRFYLLPGQEEGWGEAVLVSTLPAPGRYLWVSRISPAADIDGDGNDDLVTILTFSPVPRPPAVLDLENLQTDLVVFWSQGGGAFEVEPTRNLQVGLLPPSVIVPGDFNADGLIDLAYPDPQNLAIHVLYNRGARRFSDPYVVEVATEKDECIPLPGNLRAARLDEMREGDDIVVLGPCVFGGDNYRQFVRFLWSCGEKCWELSPLFLTGPETGGFAEVLGDLMLGDFNGDGHVDVIFTQRLFFPQKEDDLALPTVMEVYLLSGDGRGQFAAPALIGGMGWGGLLCVQSDRNVRWAIVAFSSEVNGVAILYVKADEGRTVTVTSSIPVRGYAADGVVIRRGDRREIVVVASLDLRSEITLLNVVRGVP